MPLASEPMSCVCALSISTCSLQFLSSKPMLYACNVADAESTKGNDMTAAVRDVIGAFQRVTFGLLSSCAPVVLC